MLPIINRLLDTIFPPRPTEKLIRDCVATDFYKPGSTGDIYYLSSYQDSVVAAFIKESKFHDNIYAQKQLATLLRTWLLESDSQTILIPIPLSNERQRERGYNQVERVLKHLPTIPSVRLEKSALRRIKHTLPQTTLERTARLKNLTGAFTASESSLHITPGSRVIIIDDVTTTGTTLRAARATLAPHLPTNTELLCLALAH